MAYKSAPVTRDAAEPLPTIPASDSDERTLLLDEIRKMDERIAELLPQARQLREKRQQDQEALKRRARELEDKILSCSLCPVDIEEREKQNNAFRAHRQEVPQMALQAELENWRKVGKVKDEDSDDSDDEKPQGKPPPQPSPAEKPPPQNGGLKMKKQESIGKADIAQGDCKVVIANDVLLRSPCHAFGPMQQIGYMQNVYPVTRPPWEWDRTRLWPSNAAVQLKEMWEQPIEIYQGRDFCLNHSPDGATGHLTYKYLGPVEKPTPKKAVHGGAIGEVEERAQYIDKRVVNGISAFFPY